MGIRKCMTPWRWFSPGFLQNIRYLRMWLRSLQFKGGFSHLANMFLCQIQCILYKLNLFFHKQFVAQHVCVNKKYFWKNLDCNYTVWIEQKCDSALLILPYITFIASSVAVTTDVRVSIGYNVVGLSLVSFSYTELIYYPSYTFGTLISATFNSDLPPIFSSSSEIVPASADLFPHACFRSWNFPPAVRRRFYCNSTGCTAFGFWWRHDT